MPDGMVPAGRRTVIRGVDVFDPTTQKLQRDRTIVLLGDLIEAVNDAEGDAGPTDEIVDGRGLTALPGLIDCHTHLCFDGNPARFAGTNPPGIVQGVLAANALRQHLGAGVTTVRDCGSPDGAAIDLAQAVLDGLLVGPTVLAAGRVLTMTGGHGHQVGVEVDGIDSATRATRRELANGAHFIKIMSTGGIVTKGVTPEQAALTVEEMAAIVRAAHNAGKRVTAHATGLAGAKNAMLAGVDSIEHGYQLDDEAIDLALKGGVHVVPTLVVPESLAANIDRVPGWMAEKIPPQQARQVASIRRALAAGIPLATGTDGGTPYNPHGGLPREIELLVEIGMSPAQALTSATLTSAATVGLESTIGSIEPGKRADIVLIAGDPTVDISAIRSVRLVFSRGAAQVTARPST